MLSREWNSATYHRLSDHQYDWGMKVLGRVRARGDETVLDAGCGTGRLTAGLLECVPAGRVIAADLSLNMLLQARTFLLPRFSANVRLICADLAALPFCDALDGVFSTAAFHWVPNHPRLFASLYGALRPGGWLVAQCGGGANLSRLRAHAAEVMAGPKFAEFFAGWSDPWEFATAEITAARLCATGFVKVETWVEPAAFSLPDAETFREYLATVTLHRHLERLPDAARREAFLSELTERCLAGEGLGMDYWRLNLDAKKPK